MSKLNAILFKPSNPASLGLFRFFYGLIVIVHLIEQWKYIHINFIQPKFYFTYPFLDFIHPLPGIGMYILNIIMFLCAVGIMFGIAFRRCMIIFLPIYLYIFLIDATYYKNHYYLLFLIGFLLSFTPADRCFVFQKPKKIQPCYSFHHYLLRFQYCIVYFYAGIAKLNWDWFHGEPVRHLLREGAASHKHSFLSAFYQFEWFIYFVVYSGAVFDLFISFFLLNRLTRKYAALAVVIFNVSNHLMFPNILIFPFLMMSGVIIFFNSDWPARNKFLNYYCKERVKESPGLSEANKNKTVILIGLYIILQIVLPLRHYIYPGDILWTSQGENFSWRMIMKWETAELKMFIIDPKTGEKYKPAEGLVNFRQFIRMSTCPEFILQFAHYLKSQTDIKEPVIMAENRHSINGRLPQNKIKPNINLADIKPTQNYMDWMYPFDNRLPER